MTKKARECLSCGGRGIVQPDPKSPLWHTCQVCFGGGWIEDSEEENPERIKRDEE